MSSPTIPDLPSASAPADTDQMLIRQPAGALGTDKKVTIEQIRNLNLAGLSGLPTGKAIPSDLMVIERAGGNYQIPFSDVGFVAETKMWFYANSAPDGWTPITTTDNLLAVKGSSGYTIGGSVQGNWQQKDHTLTISEIPSHSHVIGQRGAASGSGNVVWGSPSGSNPVTNNYTTNTTGGGGGHNHGSTWRPRANVGILCEKS